MPTDCYLIDGTALIFRSFFSMRSITTPDGVEVNAVFGVMQSLLKFIREQKPEQSAVIFDAGPVTFRNEIYPDYKANREEPADDLIPQFDLSRELASALGFPTFAVPGFEADDVIGTLAVRKNHEGMRVLIGSNDKDFSQIVTDTIVLYDMKTGETTDAAAVEEQWGIPPDRIIDFLAIQGDSVDNVPGMPGIGKKTAQTILAAGLSVEQLAEQPDLLDPLPLRGKESLKKKFVNGLEQYKLSRTLVTLDTDVPLPFDDLAYAGPPRDEIFPFCERMGFSRVQERIENLIRE